MSEVFKLAVKGVRVQGARAKDLIIDSDHPNPKISVLANPPHAGNIFLDWQSTTGVDFETIITLYPFPHGFQYVPTVFASYQFDNGSVKEGGTLPFQLGALGMIVIDADATNINLKYFSFDQSIPATAISPFTMNIRYYVLVEPGQ